MKRGKLLISSDDNLIVNTDPKKQKKIKKLDKAAPNFNLNYSLSLVQNIDDQDFPLDRNQDEDII